jgi:hypothetical protein
MSTLQVTENPAAFEMTSACPPAMLWTRTCSSLTPVVDDPIA